MTHRPLWRVNVLPAFVLFPPVLVPYASTWPALPRLSGLPSDTIPDPLDLACGAPMDDARYMVVKVGDVVVGAVALLRETPAARYGYHTAHVAQVQIDVLPDWRDVGEVLVGGLVEWARTQPGLKRIEFDTLSCNEWLIDLLGQAGFVVEGRARASWYARTADGEIYLDRVRMGLLLDEALPIEATTPAETTTVPDPSIPDVDCSAFFADLTSQVRAFLPYELREFKMYETANEVHTLIDDLSEGITFAVAFRLASDEFGTPDMIEVGLHLRRDPDFNQAQVERLRARLETLGEALGNKTLYADVWREGWGRVALRLPYQSPGESHAFMLAAQVAGFITVMLPEAKSATD